METEENIELLNVTSYFSTTRPQYPLKIGVIKSKLDQTLLNQYREQGINIYSEEKNGSYFVHIPLLIEQLSQFELIIEVNPLLNHILFLVYLINEEGRVTIKNKAMRLQLSRYMLRLNNNLRVGTFFIDPIRGYIGAKFFVQISPLQFTKMFYSDKDDLSKFLQSMIFTACNSIRFHMYRLLVLNDIVGFTKFNYLEQYLKESNVTAYRKFPAGVDEILLRIKLTMKNVNKMFTKEEIDEKTQYYQIINKIPKSTQGLTILTDIEFFNPQELREDTMQKINSGGFCDIFTKELRYSIVKYEGKSIQNSNGQLALARGSEVIKRFLAIKKVRAETQESISPQLHQRISNELDILKILREQKDQELRTGQSPFIAQFYYNNNNPEVLMMERYFHASLDYFKSKFQDTLSLSTKITIAYNIAQGLRYIHSYDIVHLDIKPANILIAKNNMAKITDFGEAIDLKKSRKDKTFGRTYPYVPPEYFGPPEKITTAYDIFSFGVMLYELIFNRYPIDFRKDKLDQLEEKIKKSTYYVRHDKECEQDYGPKVIIKQLANLSIQCLQPDPTQRPCIDKITLILKDSLSFLEKMY